MSDPFVAGDKITLLNGEEIALPKLSLGKILAVTKKVSALVDIVKKELPDIANDFAAAATGNSTTQIGLKLAEKIPIILPVVLDQAIDILSAYLGKDRAFIEDNFEIEDFINVLTPFLGSIFKAGNTATAAFNRAFASKEPPQA